MKNKFKWLKKPAHFALTLLVIAILGVGTTIAFFTDIEAAVNRITFGKIEIELNEEIDGLTKTGIGVTSTGNSEAYVRMRVDVPMVTYKYIDKNGKEQEGHAEITLPDWENPLSSLDRWFARENIDVTVIRSNNTTSPASWVKASDGFWYLSVTLKKGDYAPFLSKIEYPGLLKGGKLELPVGLTADRLSIPIVSEAVQAEGLNITDEGAAIEAFWLVEQGQSN